MKTTGYVVQYIDDKHVLVLPKRYKPGEGYQVGFRREKSRDDLEVAQYWQEEILRADNAPDTNFNDPDDTDSFPGSEPDAESALEVGQLQELSNDLAQGGPSPAMQPPGDRELPGGSQSFPTQVGAGTTTTILPELTPMTTAPAESEAFKSPLLRTDPAALSSHPQPLPPPPAPPRTGKAIPGFFSSFLRRVTGSPHEPTPLPPIPPATQ